MNRSEWGDSQGTESDDTVEISQETRGAERKRGNASNESNASKIKRVESNWQEGRA